MTPLTTTGLARPAFLSKNEPVPPAAVTASLPKTPLSDTVPDRVAAVVPSYTFPRAVRPVACKLRGVISAVRPDGTMKL